MATITLFHVSSKLRESLAMKVAKDCHGKNDHEGVYCSFTIKQASIWAMELTLNRGVPFQYFYEVQQVNTENLYQKSIHGNLIPWQGEEIEEVIYVGPPLDNIKLLAHYFHWDGFDCYLDGHKIEYPYQDYGEDILCPELSDEEVMALIG